MKRDLIHQHPTKAATDAGLSSGLHRLNPSKHFDQPDTEIWVANVTVAKLPKAAPLKAASVIVTKSKNTVTAVDRAGKVVAQFPCTSGSDHDPLPMGEWKVKDIVDNPPSYYSPDLFWNSVDHPTHERRERGEHGELVAVLGERFRRVDVRRGCADVPGHERRVNV
jgi:hypothetical protein